MDRMKRTKLQQRLSEVEKVPVECQKKLGSNPSAVGVHTCLWQMKTGSSAAEDVLSNTTRTARALFNGGVPQ
eukprot:5749921-Amphidinium_carterae.1